MNMSNTTEDSCAGNHFTFVSLLKVDISAVDASVRRFLKSYEVFFLFRNLL